MIEIDVTMRRSSIVEVLRAIGISVKLTEKRQGIFLSIITRTQGRRPELLQELMLCLMAQECDDFEWLITAHNVDKEKLEEVEKMVENAPDTFRSKVHILDVRGGGRTEPLNVGFKGARGKYIAVLDDDDIVLGNWVKEFKEMAQETTGKVLRTMPLWQDFAVGEDPISGSCVARTEGGPTRGPESYDFLGHFTRNETPIHCLAFPAAAFQDFDIRFDDNLNTTEDWDFLLHTIGICGVGDSATPTAIYRRFKNLDNSQEEHNRQEWQRCEELVKLNVHNRYFIIPPNNIFSSFVKNTTDSISDKRKSSTIVLLKKAFFVLKQEGLVSLIFKVKKKLRERRTKKV